MTNKEDICNYCTYRFHIDQGPCNDCSYMWVDADEKTYANAKYAKSIGREWRGNATRHIGRKL